MKLTLIGAGPGDPDLITMKGVKALQNAKVVLYDSLAHPSLLDYCPEDCVKILVGKRFGKTSCAQDDINALIVENARLYGEVVRLKGGDSFVFGRGYEEILYAAKHGIESEIIPGISSSYAAPALAGIPLTSRGLSESFWVITGTTKQHALSNDVHLAAQSTATVVILMGLHKLDEIVSIYADLNKFDESISIIQNGTLENQKVVTGKISNIAALAKASEIASPAVIVIGKVAALPDLSFADIETLIQQGKPVTSEVN
ncbi:uroporphyrinogen-III C-methyltransferase [Dyadobacter chenwenxiniae]|uniref:uroporphyrinogen-III C-methyltransferase n=1 Tax=Dyadobacter chenwenxiniae TaxID=2906456 RepID=A0A9X1TMI2_9BACT|nr:uroporphyrinogen-III C-methyltransferase [Dyadobacter chenwenxiniae]MCF0063538.1 uroporphyrinogen-III C-methyltransferase [Dyadobacter chenwenxiniae]UON83216.1 uroporphyrinogen-III C-methyltransferase [Dyadobacter chenwenxiniae]